MLLATLIQILFSAHSFNARLLSFDNRYKNQAKEAIANATAMSKLLMDQAEVDYSRTIESVHNEGLKSLYDGLAISDDKLKASLNYMRTLKDHEKVKYSIDFNSLIAKQQMPSNYFMPSSAADAFCNTLPIKARIMKKQHLLLIRF